MVGQVLLFTIYITGLLTADTHESKLHSVVDILGEVNPFVPTVAFLQLSYNICCPRQTNKQTNLLRNIRRHIHKGIQIDIYNIDQNIFSSLF